jgi:hypothetical protein
MLFLVLNHHDLCHLNTNSRFGRLSKICLYCFPVWNVSVEFPNAKGATTNLGIGAITTKLNIANNAALLLD